MIKQLKMHIFKKISLIIYGYIIFILHFYVLADQTRCFTVEGSKLPRCSVAAMPRACGPPKPCPSCAYVKLEGTYFTNRVQGGVCTAYGEPVCHQDGDTLVCGDAPCLTETDPVCYNEEVQCGQMKYLPQEGTYDCENWDCSGCPPVHPDDPSFTSSNKIIFPCQQNQCCEDNPC